MTKNISQKSNLLIEKFNNFSNWEEKYSEVIKMGKELASMPEKFVIDDNKVKGCQSQVWLYPDMKSSLDEVFFYADSDALIAKGLIALVMGVYNGSSVSEILNTPPDFINKMDLQTHLSPNRSNGIQAMVKQIKMYAYVLQMKASINK